MKPRFKTTTGGLNVLSGPGSGCNRIGSLSVGRVIEEISITDLCPFALGSGVVGWVPRKYLVPYEDMPEEELK